MHHFSQPGFGKSAAALLLAAAALAGCAGGETATSQEARLAAFDSLLADLGGPQTTELTRAQRWKLIASVGTGLPPASYRPEDLPEPEARGAALQQAYCTQCHGISSPRMHTADEWPVLIRRMIMRASHLRERLGGPRTAGMVDRMLLAGLRTAAIPAAEDADSLIAYFTRHALPAAAEGEIPDTPDARLFIEKCSGCHDTPSPAAHPPDQIEALVARMSAMMSMLGMTPPTESERARIVAFMQQVTP